MDYSPKEVNELEDDGVNWALVVVTQGVEKKMRRKLFDKVMNKKWNLDELAFMIAKRKGNHHAGGRHARVPPSLELGLRQMKRLCGRRLLFHREVWPKVCPTVRPARLSTASEQLLDDTMDAVAAVEKVAREVRESLRKVAPRRKSGT